MNACLGLKQTMAYHGPAQLPGSSMDFCYRTIRSVTWTFTARALCALGSMVPPAALNALLQSKTPAKTQSKRHQSGIGGPLVTQ